jgi:hypothetical protein
MRDRAGSIGWVLKMWYSIAEQTHHATPTEDDDKGASSNTGDKQAS